MRLDWWLIGICTTRAFGGMFFVTYAAALPVLQHEWGMSASAAGAVLDAGVSAFDGVIAADGEIVASVC